ncbi:MULTISPECIES: exo-beta-N-acetylmuramidase NamZ family protein [unclassified Microbacterium]|uniref:exo-beta-N-acetylmuramidase NamZ family protein n=1 Tax=unclassified Microbacterium TaxID=2609290 RepID=UPI003015BAE2
MAQTDQQVLTGVQRVIADRSLIRGSRVGLLTNFTGTAPDLGRSIDALRGAGVPITALFAPEHGLGGAAQAGAASSAAVDGRTGLPIYDTYLASSQDLDLMLAASGVDELVFDMQDIGVRFYTYVWTLFDLMHSAARIGIRFTVLDRPNPLGGALAAGPGIASAEYASFVGRTDIRQRHGLSAGELARLFVSRDLARAGLAVDLTVVQMQGWDASRGFAATGTIWVPPSPNMPTLDTAYAFCGTGLLEGTTLSEGRGTTRPFEIVGAPFLSDGFAQTVRALGLPGVVVREVEFEPTFHKFAGELCRGIQLHIVDRVAYEPVRTAVEILRLARADAPDAVHSLAAGERLDPGDRGYALDRLWGSSTLRRALDEEGDFDSLSVSSTRVDALYGDDVLLYPR